MIFGKQSKKANIFIFFSLTNYNSGVIIYSINLFLGEKTMKEMQIKLFTIQQVREFVSQVILQDFEVDLVQGRYIIDAKSIMGIFSLDLLSPITVRVYIDSADEFFKSIEEFKAD